MGLDAIKQPSACAAARLPPVPGCSQNGGRASFTGCVMLELAPVSVSAPMLPLVAAIEVLPGAVSAPRELN